MLFAYLDAGTQNDTFSVSALAFGPDRAKKALRQWQRLWGNVRCHMSDLHNRKGEFASWSREAGAERLKKCIPIMQGFASYGVAVSVNLHELKALAPTKADKDSKQFLDGFRTAYAFCCHMAMAHLAYMTSANEQVRYVFESGDLHQGESQRFISLIAAYPHFARHLYRWQSHTVESKQDTRLFEMSDIIAWEWARHVNRQAMGKDMRGSLKALVGKGAVGLPGHNIVSEKYRLHHMTSEPLKRYFTTANELELFSDDPSEVTRKKLAEASGKVINQLLMED